MRFKSIILTLVMSVGLFSLSSCSDDDKIKENSGCTGFDIASADFSEALNNYIEDPSVENCNNYKNALVSLAKKYQDCPSWPDDYDNYLEMVEEIDCTEETNM